MAAAAHVNCQQADSNDPSKLCGAASAADQRCLAHLTPDVRSAYLATLAPEADIDAQGVTFTEDLLFELLTALHDPRNRPRFGTADFSEATFIGDADFSGATFAGNVRLDRATFAENARFDRVFFAMNAQFDGVAVADGAWFNSAVVLGELRVEAIAKRIYATGLRGDGQLIMRLRAAEVDLSDVTLPGPVRVLDLQHAIKNVDERAFCDEAGQVPQVRVVSLRDVDAASVTMTDVDLSGCLFAGLQRADQVVLDGRCVFADGPRGRRRVLAEEHHWRATRAMRAARASGDPPQVGGWRPNPYIAPGQEIGPARVEVLYRQLRKALEDAKNEPGAADFYYGEMEMRRAASNRRSERWLLDLYWAISGYGLRARRALAWLMVLAVLSVDPNRSRSTSASPSRSDPSRTGWRRPPRSRSMPRAVRRPQRPALLPGSHCRREPMPRWSSTPRGSRGAGASGSAAKPPDSARPAATWAVKRSDPYMLYGSARHGAATIPPCLRMI